MTCAPPLAARLGLVHVFVAQCRSGLWSVMAWTGTDGPRMVHRPCSYGGAVALAKAHATKVGGIFDHADDTALIHVLRTADGSFEVYQESRSGTSGATLDVFPPDSRDEAIAFALSQLGEYAPCKLGSID